MGTESGANRPFSQVQQGLALPFAFALAFPSSGPARKSQDAIWMAYFYSKKVVRLEVAKVCGIPDAHTEIGQEKLSHPTRDADALPFGEVLPDSCPSRQGFAVVKQNEFMNHSWNMLQQSSWYNCTYVCLTALVFVLMTAFTSQHVCILSFCDMLLHVLKSR